MIEFEGFDINENEVINKRGLQENGKVQKYVDNEVIRLSDPLVPVLTHTLRQSSLQATTLGTGLVQYNTPYARRQYYENDGRWQSGNRGKLWFERMKAQYKDEILKGAKEVAGK